MKDFVEADLTAAYRMLSECRTAIVATKGAAEGLYNLTPYGWFMPMDYEPVTKVIISSDPAHQAAIILSVLVHLRSAFPPTIKRNG